MDFEPKSSFSPMWLGTFNIYMIFEWEKRSALEVKNQLLADRHLVGFFERQGWLITFALSR